MKIGIWYAGKNGTTAKCAKLVQDKLGSCDVFDLTKTAGASPAEYDIIIVGSNIHIGIFHGKVKKWLQQYQEVLLQKSVYYYICCGIPAQKKEYFNNNVSASLLQAAKITDTFGGEIEVASLRGLDKMIASMIMKSETFEKPQLLDENIASFVKVIQTELK